MTHKKCGHGKMPNMGHEAKEAAGTIHGMGSGGVNGLQSLLERNEEADRHAVVAPGHHPLAQFFQIAFGVKPSPIRCATSVVEEQHAKIEFAYNIEIDDGLLFKRQALGAIDAFRR